MKYVVGIDGGGTSSILLAADMEGNLLGKAVGGPTNITSLEYDTVKNTLRMAIKELLDSGNLQPQNCMGVCIGTAGVNRDEERLKIQQLIRDMGLPGEVIVVNDSEIALAAGADRDEGIIVVAGTGSIAFGKNAQGISCTAGGWGHLIGDEGSGYWIGKRAIDAALRYHEGRGRATILLDALMKEIGIDRVDDFIGYVYEVPFDKKKIAALAVVVEKAQEEGDAAAKEIILEAAGELALLVESIIVRLGFGEETNLIVSGSVLLKNDFLYQSFEGRLKEKYPKLHIKKLQQEAAWGAVKLGLSAVQKSQNQEVNIHIHQCS